MNGWHNLTTDAVLDELGSDPQNGLDQSVADHRLDETGPNELEEAALKSPWKILWEQMTASMVVILIVAAAISALLGDWKDAIAILVIVVLNALLGFRQEYKAEKAMAALKTLAVPRVKVVRGGRIKEISARLLVSGDLVLLEEGDLVPADCRLLESVNLKIQEAALTGESAAAEKNAGAVSEEDVPLGDRFNMAYMGTVVIYGRGRGIVTETGMRTELGRVASMIQTIHGEPTPLQRRLNRLGRTLALAAVILVAVVVGLGLLRGEQIRTLFLTAISLAVAAVPEGLPAVVTIVLALGAQRMLKRNALIRKLPAVEALGSVTVICSDKTGTLTENRMRATSLYVAGGEIDLSAFADKSNSEPGPSGNGSPIMQDHPPAALLLAGSALCNNASLEAGDGPENAQVIGDPTEGALIVAAARMGFRNSELEKTLPRVAEIPFSSERKMMTTVHELRGEVGQGPEWLRFLNTEPVERIDQPYLSFTKGAVDRLLEQSSHVLAGGGIEPIGAHRENLMAANDRLAERGMRVLGVACRRLETKDAEDAENNLIFIGMVGMIDPPRPEAGEAVKTCRTAGIRPIMITGDHPLTAQSIASELGIASNARALTGRHLARMSAPELEKSLEDVSVFARVAPEHKLRIIQALQNKSHVVAMTGDGVNDAPALKKADIGVAMGITGTDVSKEVADMVLLDDNFATIVSAIEEGRVIYDNLRKFVKYLLTTNAGEILVMIAAPFLGMPLPLLPLQILWINLVTDGLPALALGLEPAEKDVMRRPPRRPGESIFAHGLGRHIVWVGVLMGAAPLLLGHHYWRMGSEVWQTLVFTTLALAQMAHVLAIRSERHSLFSIGILSNKALLGAVLLTLVLQVAIIYIPFLQKVFHTAELSALELGYCAISSSIIFWAVEAEKLFLRLRSRQA